MSFTGTVILKASTAIGPQVWTITGAVDAEDAVSLVGTPGGSISEITNLSVQLFVLRDVTISIPDNATITSVRFVVITDGFAGGTAFIRFGLGTEATPITRLNGFDKTYNDLTDFGQPGVLWTRGILNSNNADIICGNTGFIVIDAYYVIVSFTIPDWPLDPIVLDVAGGQTLTFQLSSGSFFDAFYEWMLSTIFSLPQTPVVADVRTLTCVTTVLPHGALPTGVGCFISDPEADETGIRPYNRPYFQDVSGQITADETTGFGWFVSTTFGTGAEVTSTLPVGNVTMGGAYSSVLSIDVSGIYALVEGKTDDTLYVRAGSSTTQDVMIPNPYVELGYIGDE